MGTTYYAMLLLQRVLVCVAAWFCAVDGAITDYGVPGLAPKRFPKNAGPDGRAVRTNLNPLMGAKARRTSDDRFGGATRAPEASLVGRSESAARAPSADAQSRGQPQAVPDPVQPAGKFAPKPRRSRFAAPVRQGSPPNTPVGAARRVLSQPGFPSRPMMPGQASDPLHSRLMQSDPFSSSGTNAFGNAQPGIPGKRSRFGARNHPKIPEQHGRPAAREDTMPRQTIGAINNNDKSFIPEQTELNSDRARAAAARVAARTAPEPEFKSANEMVTLEGASHYEPALGEMLYHLRLHNTHRTQFTGLLIVTTSLPHGSKPQHSYWIRNRKRNPGERPEQHDCVVKRLTLTCKVHKLAPGQLATIYLHNKQRESGLSPAHTSVTADGKVRATTSM